MFFDVQPKFYASSHSGSRIEAQATQRGTINGNSNTNNEKNRSWTKLNEVKRTYAKRRRMRRRRGISKCKKPDGFWFQYSSSFFCYLSCFLYFYFLFYLVIVKNVFVCFMFVTCWIDSRWSYSSSIFSCRLKEGGRERELVSIVRLLIHSLSLIHMVPKNKSAACKRKQKSCKKPV